MSNTYRDIICSHIANNWIVWEDKVKLTHDKGMTILKYLHEMVYGTGWATACEIEAAALLFHININVWLHQTLNVFRSDIVAMQNIHMLLFGSHFSPMRQSVADHINSSQTKDTEKAKQASDTQTCKSTKRGISSPTIFKKSKKPNKRKKYLP